VYPSKPSRLPPGEGGCFRSFESKWTQRDGVTGSRQARGDWGALQTAVVKQTLVGLPVHASDRLRPVKPVGSG